MCYVLALATKTHCSSSHQHTFIGGVFEKLANSICGHIVNCTHPLLGANLHLKSNKIEKTELSRLKKWAFPTSILAATLIALFLVYLGPGTEGRKDWWRWFSTVWVSLNMSTALGYESVRISLSPVPPPTRRAWAKENKYGIKNCPKQI